MYGVVPPISQILRPSKDAHVSDLPVQSKVKRLGLLPGQKPFLQNSSKESSSRNVILVPQGKDSSATEKQSPIGGGSKDVEEILADDGSRGTQRNAEEGVSSSQERFSSEEVAKEAPQPKETGNSSRNTGDSSGNPQGSFAEEMRERRKMMQLVRESPRESREEKARRRRADGLGNQGSERTQFLPSTLLLKKS
jgi:hypothetical protein